MNSSPSISILMPTHTDSFLDEAVDSVLQQTFKNWKLLIGVNNYSHNPSLPEKIKNTLPPDNRIHLHLLKDCTSKSQALNQLIDLCQTEWASLLDSDDLWLPSKLEKQAPLTETYDVIGTQCFYFGTGLTTDMPNQPHLPLGDINPSSFFDNNPIINSSAVFRASDGKWDPSVEGVEDYDMWLRLNKEKKTFYNIGEALCLHRLHQQSSFNTRDFSRTINSIKKKWKIPTS